MDKPWERELDPTQRKLVATILVLAGGAGRAKGDVEYPPLLALTPHERIIAVLVGQVAQMQKERDALEDRLLNVYRQQGLDM